MRVPKEIMGGYRGKTQMRTTAILLLLTLMEKHLRASLNDTSTGTLGMQHAVIQRYIQTQSEVIQVGNNIQHYWEERLKQHLL